MIPPWGTPISVAHKLNFECTNNMAEYEALVLGLQNAINIGAPHIDIFGDSELIVNQVTGVYQCKNDILQKYRDTVLVQLQSFDKFTIQAIPRTVNRFTDTMASLASLILPFTEDSRLYVAVQRLDQPSHLRKLTSIHAITTHTQDEWYQQIVDYLSYSVLPPDLTPNGRRYFILRANHYTILGGILYRRGFDGNLLRCLKTLESSKAIQEVHDGIYGGHFSGLAVSKRILRLGYYWPSLNRDCCEYTKKCVKCQQHSNLTHIPSQALQPTADLWPFSQWGLDLIGLINPRSSQRHHSIITATEYFTKWVEAIPLSSTKAKPIVDFVYQHIICRFGVPHKLITDNGKSFKNIDLQNLCDAFNIKLSFSSPYYPQANG
ncbi:hypothetical protein KI387_043681 [Taxus chinensis]|uniref:Integrase catalytic domain-containing protein n=1 Tax=Taxus chinensis TaxID=29808 RepID=A0AA38H3V1_TAXCH|nr:hypothetical protein KI387_043681 [Taxus chinensis]